MLLKLKLYLKRYTFARLLNLLIAEIQYNLKSLRLHCFPIAITIEPGNICNLRCPLCPTGQNDKSTNHGFIEFSTFKKIVDEIGKYILLIRLYNWGEPLLNRNLTKMVEYAVNKGIEVKISTNLSLELSDLEAEAIIKTNLRKIYVSANGASNETYLKYHIGGDFDKVMKNIKLLIQKKKDLNNQYTEIIWLFHVFSHNEHEIDKANIIAKELGIRLNINKMRTDMGKEIFETPEEAIKRDSKWLPENPEYKIFDVNNKKTKKQFICNLLWKETVINWNGTVMPCCYVYNDGFSFGNIIDKPFKEIWNNDKYLSARKAIHTNEHQDNSVSDSETSHNKKIVCQTCKSKGFPFN